MLSTTIVEPHRQAFVDSLPMQQDTLPKNAEVVCAVPPVPPAGLSAYSLAKSDRSPSFAVSPAQCTSNPSDQEEDTLESEEIPSGSSSTSTQEQPDASDESLPSMDQAQQEAEAAQKECALEQAPEPAVAQGTPELVPPAPLPAPGSTHHLLSIRLLKDVSLTLCVPDGREIVIPLSLQAKRIQLLAYIAWRRGEKIERERLLEQVFGWGLSDEEATDEKLTERFESHKKLLRRKIKEVAMEVNASAGTKVLDSDIDPFVFDTGFWGLSGICRVEDLEVIEANYKVIAQARKEGKLVDEIPPYVKQACDRLIANYPGDFLETMIKKHSGEFRPFQGRSSWARRPFTLFRDYYLDALWYAAEYEWQQGQRLSEEQTTEDDLSQNRQQEHYARAADLYQTYALYACNTKFDTKVTLGANGEAGERVGMSERAIRRCVMLLGKLGKTDHINQVWSNYNAQMKTTFDQRWTPSKETVSDVEAARAQTNAYRFSAQIAALAQRQPQESTRF